MALNKIGNRYYLDNCWYMVENSWGEFDVYDEGEYEGRYCGSLEYLETMTPDEALDYVLAGL